MVNMTSASVSSKKGGKLHESSLNPSAPTDQINGANRNSVMMDEYSDDDEEFQIAEAEQEVWFAQMPGIFFILSLKSECKLFTFFRQTHLGLRVISREQVDDL